MSTVGYREKCLSEKGAACDRCGSDEKVVAHHINGDRSDNRIKNLIPVCAECHNQIHRGRVEGLSEKLPLSARIDRPDVSAPYKMVHVSSALAEKLFSYKRRGDAYEDVIWRLIEQADQEDDQE